MPRTSTLQKVRELTKNTVLEEGDSWYAVAVSWWEEFQASSKANDGPSVQNEPLVDTQLSSKDRHVAVLKPQLEEGVDFVFVSEGSWDVIAHELGYDWEIRREVIYQRSRLQLQLDSYPYVFKIRFWTCDAVEPSELVDEAGQVVVLLGYRSDTLGRLLSEVWRAAPDEFRRQFPQFLFGIGPTSPSLPDATTSADVSRVRACYRKSWASNSELVWVSINQLLKRARGVPQSLRLKPRITKRQACRDEGSRDGQQRGEDAGASELDPGEGFDELEEDRGGLIATMNLKLDDLRLDRRSEVATGDARLHELLIEQKAQDAGSFGWPSQGAELRWRMHLTKGDTLDVLDTTPSWLEARLLATKRTKVCVHYRSWESKWDEWITRTSPRIAPPYSRVPKWRSALKAHDLVQVGVQLPRLRHTKWRNATVVDVVSAASAGAGKKSQRSDGDGVGLQVRVRVDGGEVWLPAHDDLLCQVNTHTESSALSKRELGLLLARNAFSMPEPRKVTEEVSVPTEGGNGDELQGQVKAKASRDEDGDDPTSRITSPGSSSCVRSPHSTSMPVETSTPSRSSMNLRTRAGPARDLSDSFSQAQVRGQSSAGHTPARRRSRCQSSQSFSDNTSPEPVSPASIPPAGRPGSRDLSMLWAQVSTDLLSLQASWVHLGEEVVAVMEAFERGRD